MRQVGRSMGIFPGSEPWLLPVFCLLPVRCVGGSALCSLGCASRGLGLAGCWQKLSSALEMQDGLPRKRFASPDDASRP